MAFTSNEARLRTVVGGSGSPINLKTDSGIKVMLVQSSYTPDRDHQFVSSITDSPSKELSGTGYVAGFGGSGRKACAGRDIVKVDASDLVKFVFDDMTWAAINAGTARYAYLIKEVTSDADSPIIGYADLNPTGGITFNGNDWTLDVPANGFLTWKSP